MVSVQVQDIWCSYSFVFWLYDLPEGEFLEQVLMQG